MYFKIKPIIIFVLFRSFLYNIPFTFKDQLCLITQCKTNVFLKSFYLINSTFFETKKMRCGKKISKRFGVDTFFSFKVAIIFVVGHKTKKNYNISTKNVFFLNSGPTSIKTITIRFYFYFNFFFSSSSISKPRGPHN